MDPGTLGNVSFADIASAIAAALGVLLGGQEVRKRIVRKGAAAAAGAPDERADDDRLARIEAAHASFHAEYAATIERLRADLDDHRDHDEREFTRVDEVLSDLRADAAAHSARLDARDRDHGEGGEPRRGPRR